ncbi:MAG: hypothetical protein HFI60_06345 [Lachnospiraceae bacterium]|nr:hypothetical protein [Lachnospiraceae bacterium]
MQRRKNNRKSNGKKTARKTNRRDIFAEDFFREEDGDFDEEDMDNVTDDTLEFLSLDDEMIEDYNRAHKRKESGRKASASKASGKGKVYEEIEEIYEDEEEYAAVYEDEEDDGYDGEEYEEEEDDGYGDETYAEEDGAYGEYEAYAEDDDEDGGYEAYEDEEDDRYDEEAYDEEDDGYGEEAYDEEIDGYDEEYDDEDDGYDEEYDEEDEEYDDEDDEYEYGEYDDDEDYEYDEEERDGVIVRIRDFMTHMSTLDVVVAMLGIVVLAGVFLSGGLYLNARSVARQVDAFASVGEELAGISVIGESGLVAVSESAKLSNMIDLEEETPEEEVQEEIQEDQKKGVEVTLNLTSIQSDLKVKFVNKATGKLIGGVPFEVEVSGKKSFEMKDDDKDGIIYQTGIAAGDYSVKIKPFADNKYADYKLPSSAGSVTVKDTITYKKVDVVDEVKTEAEVNAAAEDTAQQNTVVESALKDTVEWVESTRTPVGEEKATYTEVNKKDIPDPWKIAGMGGTFMKMVNDGVQPTTEGVDTPGDPTDPVMPPDPTDPDQTPDPGTAPGQTPDKPTDPDNPVTPPEPEKPDVPPEQAKPSLSLTTSLSLQVGGAGSLTATNVSAGASVKWTYNTNGVIAVSESGNTVNVSATGAGQATITATPTLNGVDGDSVSCVVTVTEDPKPSATISLDTQAITLKKGESRVLKATVSTGATPAWMSGNKNVATVDMNGTVTAVAAGSTTITATAEGVSASCTVTVTDEQAAFSLNPASLELKKGEAKDIAVVSNVQIKSVAWGTDNPASVTVSGTGQNGATGRVTGVKEGNATLTVSITTTDNKETKLYCKVAVKGNYTKVTVTGAAQLAIGKTTTLTAVTEPKDGKITWTSSNDKIAKVDDKGVVTGVAEGQVEIKAACTDNTAVYAVHKLAVKKTVADGTTKLKDKDGNQMYYLDASGAYKEATYDDYSKYEKFYKMDKQASAYKYTGWQTIDGSVFFFDKEGNFVTGEQVIQGAKYNFGSDGKMATGSGSMGIDVSKWNGNIDWNAVKNSGVSYAIIRCGYRGSSTGALIEDPKFRSNIKGAKAAGLKVGVYFFSQAVNEVEAVEEASMALSLASGYGLNYPIFLDVESSGGRGDGISKETRTAVCKAFCSTVQNSGVSAGIYANKTWFTEKINTGSLTGYKIWLAQYASAPTYTATRYDMWQYSSKGKVSGINGNVDMNISYLNY